MDARDSGPDTAGNEAGRPDAGGADAGSAGDAGNGGNDTGDEREPVPVVTVFLRHRGTVLVLRRWEAVGSYAGRWGAVAGHAEGDPDATAREEISEETGLHDHATLVLAGEPFEVLDEDRGTRWVVHPFLFDCESRDVDPDNETVEWEWMAPTEILRRETSEPSASDSRTGEARETVRDLWTAYDRVRPTVETVAGDETHGSAYVSARALEVLRDEAALAGERGDDYEAVAGVARALRDARPSMTAVANRVDRAMAAADRSPASVERAAAETLADALDADGAAAATAADLVREGCVLTLSRSGTVAAALERADPRAVLVMESRPGREGVGVAESLATATAVTLFVDAAVGHVLATRDVDAVLVGADTVLRDGSVVNKAGTRTAAAAAAREGVPVYAVCARDKIAPDPEHDPDLEPGEPAAVYRGDADLAVENPTFDVTPPELVDGVATERGVLEVEDVGGVAEELAALSAWKP
jgi:translation initiation factor 2B subunit (eIF-2B alpha/beta/delta family)/8-oxo-dGTP pyrophosphatase MutT (NUDIX family)